MDRQKNHKQTSRPMARFLSVVVSMSMALSLMPSQGLMWAQQQAAQARAMAVNHAEEGAGTLMGSATAQQQAPPEEEQTPPDEGQAAPELATETPEEQQTQPEPAPESEPQAPEAQAESQATHAIITLHLQNAALAYAGREVHAEDLTVPLDSDMVFSVHANDGFRIVRVTYDADGKSDEIAPREDGTYIVEKDRLKDGAILSVIAEEKPAAASESTTESQQQPEATHTEAEGEKTTEQTEPEKQPAPESAPEEKKAEEQTEPKKQDETTPVEEEKSAKDEKPAVEEAKSDEKPVEEEKAKSDDKAKKSEEKKSEEKADAVESEERNTQKTFTFEDASVKVTATLADPASLPKGVDLVVTPVTPKTPAYDYDAYMDALNDASDSETTYNDQNTLLYDVAFLTTDEDGNLVEVQPAEGTVTVNFEFKRGQITEGLGAEDTSDVAVTHLPLAGDVIEEAGTTARANDISASDVSVELVDAQVNGDAATMVVEDFSIYAFSYTVDFTYDGYTYSIAGESDILLSELFSILGIDVNVADVANVEFTDESLVKVEKAGDDWKLVSLKPFDTNETLTVTLKNGAKYVIDVTDDATTQTDLNYFLENVTIAGLVLNEDQTYTAVEGQRYSIDMRFSEGADYQFNDRGTLTYQMPAGVKILDGGISNNELIITVHTHEGDKEVTAHYSISPSGALSVTFDTTDPEFEYLENATDVTFHIYYFAEFESNATFKKFNDEVARIVNVNPPEPGSVNISKRGTFNPDTMQMEYVVTVTAAGGDVEDVHVWDEFASSDQALTLMPGSIQVSSSKVTAPQYTDNHTAGKTFDYTFPSMTEGEVITITYKADVHLDKDLENDGKITVDQTKNKLAATTKTHPDPVRTEFHNEINYRTTRKSDGTVSDQTDGQGNKIIDWTIEYNKELLASAKGTPIVDTIGPGSREYMTYYGDGITVDVYNKNGTKVGTRQVSYESMHANAWTWTYTIPDEDTEVYRYVIKYQTKVDQSKIDQVGASVTLTNDGNGDGGDITIGPAEEVKIKKSHTSVSTSEITWVGTITVPKAGLSKAVVVDTFPSEWDGAYHFIDSLDVSDINIEGLLPGEEKTITPGQGQVTITFFKDADKTQEGLQPSPTTRTITVTMKFKVNQEWLNHDFAAYGNSKHTNQISINGKPSTDFVDFVKPGMVKSTQHAEDEVTNSTDTYIDYTLLLTGVSSDTFDIIDNFDTTLFEVDTTPHSQIWLNMTICGGGKWDQQQNPQPITITPNADNQGVTIHVNGVGKQTDGSYYDYYMIRYRLKIKGDKTLQDLAAEKGIALDGAVVKDIQNTATWGTTDSGYTFKTKYKPLSKKLMNGSAIGSGNRDGEFKITYNPSMATLFGGAEKELVDTMNRNLAVDASSIHVDAWNANGKLPDGSIVYKIDDYKETGATIVTYYVPDATKVEITYKAKVLGNNDVQIQNEAEVQGYSDDVNVTKDMGASGEGEANLVELKILKVDAYNQNKKLKGVKFKFYAKDGRAVSTDGHKELYYTTGDDGTFMIESGKPDDRGVKAEIFFNLEYKLEEIDPPADYARMPYAYSYTFTKNAAEVNHQNFVYFVNDSAHIENWPLEGLVLEKEVDGGDESDNNKEFTFYVTAQSPVDNTLPKDQWVYQPVNGKSGDDWFKDGEVWTVTTKKDADGKTVVDQWLHKGITIKPGVQKQFWGFKKGTKYTVTESLTGDDGALYTTTDVTYDVIVLDEDGNVVSRPPHTDEDVEDRSYEGELTSGTYETVKFTNHKVQKGSLKITKNVTVNGEQPTDGNKAAADGTFTYKVKGPGSDGDERTVMVEVVDGAAETKTVSDLEPGTYTVSELIDAEHMPANWKLVQGVDNPQTVQVVAGESAEVPTATFTNDYTYKAKGEVKVKKTLSGRAWDTDDSFTFAIEPVGDAPAFSPSTVTVTKGDQDYTKSFGEVTFTAPGTYEWKVTEEHAGETVDGVSYDSAPKTVTIKVKDDGHGHLVADDGSALVQTAAFENTYGAKGKLVLGGHKTIKNKPDSMDLSGFKFTVKEGDDVVATGSSDADGKITFTEIGYTAAGKHTYVVSEDEDSKPGVTNATSTKTVKVTVTDNGDGTLTAKADDDSPAAINAVNFENTYGANGKLVLEGHKTIKNKPESMDLSGFTFEVKKGSDVVATATSDAQGNITFPAIDYTLADRGKTYTYTVSEGQSKVKDGVTNSTATQSVTVTVTDDGKGHLVPVLVAGDSTTVATIKDVDFENTYNATGGFTFEGVSKKLTGRDLNAGEFSFVVKEAASSTVVANGTVNKNGSVTFDHNYISYTLDQAGTKEAPKQYTYIVSEVVPESGSELGGITYDASAKSIEVSVYDGGDGKIYVNEKYNPTISFDKQFENTYEANGEVVIQATKHINGRQLNADDAGKFTFHLTGPKIEGYQEKTIGGSGVATFDPIKYTQEDVADAPIKDGKRTKQFEYTITEVPQTTLGGFEGQNAFDSHEEKVTVTVVDKLDGSRLEATAVYDEDGAIFTNNYDTKGEITLSGTKTLQNRTLKEGEFTFELYAGAAEADKEPIQTTTNAADGSYSFEKIEYTSDDLDKDDSGNYVTTTKTYTVVEKAGADSSVTYATKMYPVTVTLTDNGKGTINVVADPVENTYNFTNTYNTKGEVTLSGTKTLQNRKLEEGEFTFELYAGTVEEDEKLLQTTTNAADGSYAFEKIEYTGDDLKKDADGNYVPTTKIYTVVEKAGTDSSVKYDKTKYEVTVTLTDNGKGTINVSANPAANTYNFTNTYSTKGEITLSGKKTLVNRTLKPGEFSFTLTATDAQGNALTGDAAYTETVTNAANGSYAFEKIEYTGDDLDKDDGNYKETKKYYKVVESIPAEDAANREDRVTYDTTEYVVTVTLTDNGKGKINAVVSPDNGTYDFTNTYTPDKPTFKKQIKDTNDSGDVEGHDGMWNDSADYDIGDLVPYKLTATLADDVTSYKKYHITFEDQMEDTLTFNSIQKVTLNGQNVPKGNYEFSQDDDQNFSVTLRWEGENGGEILDEDLNEAEVCVYFDARLNANANLGSEGNVNGARLRYSNNPTSDKDGDKDERKTDWDYVIAFTYRYDVSKVDDRGNALKGVEFALYKKYTANPAPTGAARYATEGEYADYYMVGQAQSSETNVFSWKGIDDGDYLLVETTVPEGFQGPSVYPFKVEAGHATTWDYTSEKYNTTPTAEGIVKRTEILGSLTGQKTSGLITFQTQDEGDDAKYLEATATNRELVKVPVTKKWINPEGADAGWPAGVEVEIALMRKKQGEADSDGKVASYRAHGGNAKNCQVTLSSNNRSYTFQDSRKEDGLLEKYYTDDEGKVQEYIYYLKELSIKKDGQDVSGYTSTLPTGPNAAGNWVINNTEQGGELTVTKTVNGAPSSAGDKTYTIYVSRTTGEGENAVTTYYWKDAEGDQQSGPTMTGTAIAANASLTFTGLPAGTYHITEDEKDARIDDYKLTVSENVTAKLPTNGEASATITNTYEREKGDFQLKKVVTGTSDDTKDFSFKVSFAAPDEVTFDAAGYAYKIYKADNSLREQGTIADVTKDYEFTLKAGEVFEVVGLPVGTTWVVDEPQASVPSGYKFDGAKGNIDAIQKGTVALVTATNTYSATGKAQLSAKKAESTTLGDRTFQFELLNADDKDKLIETSDAVKQGETAEFAPINYTLADLGDAKSKTFNYKIREVIPEGATAENDYTVDGVTYDPAVHEVPVTISDKGDGTLDVKYGNATEFAAPVFANSYNATGSIDFNGSKTMDGRDFQKGDEYTFTVTGDAPMPKETSVTIKPTEKKKADFTFGKVNYTLADLGGASQKDFVYTVTETGTVDGVAIDTAKVVRVTVADNGDGTLKVTKTGEATAIEDVSADFTNVFTPTTASISATKQINDWGTAESFTFTLASKDGAPMPADATDGKVVKTVTKDNLIAQFGSITYKKAGTYNYTITETDDGVDGVTYDTTPHDVVVTVSKNASTNALSAEVKYDEQDSLTIVNSFESTKANLQATKSINNWGKAESFTFTLEPVQGAPMPADATDGKVVKTITKDNLIAQFGDINYKKAGTYNYTITETDDGVAGITYDAKAHNVEVKVGKKEGSNKLEVKSITYDGEPSLAIVNEYKATGGAEFWAQKALSGRAAEDDEFSFVLSGPKVGEDGTETITNKGEGKVDFTPIAYDLSDLDQEVDGNFVTYKPTTLTYHIKEVIPQKDERVKGVTYDDTDAIIEVTLTDDGEGHILTSYKNRTSSGNAQGYEFKNTYDTKGDITLGGTKELQNRTLKEGEFAFELYAVDAEGNVAETPIETVTNAADGSYSFTKQTYTGADLGKDENGKFVETTKRYKVVETPGTLDGVTYDDSAYDVTVTLRDNGDGTMQVTANPAENTYDFENTYTPDKPTFQKKIMDTNDSGNVAGHDGVWQDSADYDINDMVPYKLTAKLAKDVTEYHKYHITFNDQMEESLTFASVDNIKSVKVIGADKNEITEGFEVEKTRISDQRFTVKLSWVGEGQEGLIADANLNGATVEVEFEAQLNGKAKLGKEGNVNGAQLLYSNKPSDFDDKDENERETPWDYVIAFTYEVDVNKVDPDGKSLAGAAFKLEKKLADGSKALVKEYTLDDKLTTFSFKGLDDGDYVLTETKSPKGYKLIDPVEFTVTAEHTLVWADDVHKGVAPTIDDKAKTMVLDGRNAILLKLDAAQTSEIEQFTFGEADDAETGFIATGVIPADAQNQPHDTPEFEKKTADVNDSQKTIAPAAVYLDRTWQDAADYDIDDDVPFRLHATLADDVTNYRNYHVTFTDQMEKSLTFNEESVEVYLGSQKLNADEYELVKTDDQNFTVTLSWHGEGKGDAQKQIADETLNGADVYVYFTAKLTGSDVVLGDRGNINGCKLTYSNNSTSDDSEDDWSEKPWDYVIVFTYQTDVSKVDQDGKELAGAKFELFKQLADGTLQSVKQDVTLSTDAKFAFKGLDDGTYVLKETEAPAGYRPIDDITFAVTATHLEGTNEWTNTALLPQFAFLPDQIEPARTTVLTFLGGSEVKGEEEEGRIVFNAGQPVKASGVIPATVPNQGLGALKIVKAVKHANPDDDKTVADGTYHFTITDAAGKEVTEDQLGNPIDAQITIKDGKSDTFVAQNLLPGTYTITEAVDAQTGEATGENAPKGVYLLGKNGIKVEVTVRNDYNAAGKRDVDAIPEAATASFTNSKPDTTEFEKKIADINDSTEVEPEVYTDRTWQDSADYDLDDDVPFKLTATLAEDVTDYRNYHITFTDKMESSLLYNKDAKVYITAKDGSAIEYDEAKVEKTENDHDFELTLRWAGEGEGNEQQTIADEALNGATVDVVFSAKLTGDDVVYGAKGNVNEAMLTYSNNPSFEDGGKSEGTKPWDYVIAFTYKLDVSKLTPAGTALEGAEFKLEKQLADGTLKEVALAVDGNTFTGTGLDDGIYVLTETKAPVGYKAIDPVAFTVAAAHEAEWDERNQTGKIPETRTVVLTDLTGNAADGALTFEKDDELSTLTTDVTDQEIRDLSLTKKLDASIANDETALATEFGYTVTLTDVPAWYAKGDFTVATNNGEATFTYDEAAKTWTTNATLKANETITYVGLPKGAKYTITEAADALYGVVKIAVDGKDATKVKNGAASSTTTGTLDGEDGAMPATVEYTNASVSSLQVSKANDFSGLDLTEAQKQAILHSITFTVTGPDGFSESRRMDESDYFIKEEGTDNYVWTLVGLAPGDYTVSETRDEVGEGGLGNRAKFGGEPGSAHTYTLDGGAPVRVDVANSFASVEREAKVSVTKEVLGDDFEKDEEFTFELAKATGEYASDDDQLTGDTTVSVQRSNDGYSVGEFGSIAFMTNTGTFYYTINEVVPEQKTLGMDYDTTPTWVRVDLDANGGDAVVHYGTEDEVTSGGGTQLDAAAGVPMENTYTRPGSLRVAKHVEGTELTDEERAQISFTVTGPDGFEETRTLAEFEDESEAGDPAWLIEDLPAGEYKVTETGADVRGASWAVATTYSAEDGVVEIKDQEDAEVTVTNAYERAFGLQVTKVVSGLTLTDEERAEISFEVSGPDGITLERTLDQFEETDAEGNPVWSIYETDDGEALPAGTYTVTETGGELFDRDGVEYERTTTYRVGEEVTAEAAELEVTASGTAKAVVTNAYESPKGVAKIRVAKAFEGDYQGDERFEFVLADEDGNEVGRAKAANGETAEFAPIRYKADDADGEFVYTITEVVPDEPTAGVVYNTDPVEVTVTLDEDLNASVVYGEDEEADHATVTNKLEAPEAEAGTITVRKVVSSTRAEDKQKDFGFRVTLLESDNKTTRKLSGTYGDMEFTDGVAEFTLKADESRTARDLPFDEAGEINYSCEEIDAGGLTPSLKDEKNEAGNGATITCTNTYKPGTPQEKSPTSSTVRSTGATRTSTPKTGDPTSFLPLIALAVVGIAALAFGLTRRRK